MFADFFWSRRPICCGLLQSRFFSSKTENMIVMCKKEICMTFAIRLLKNKYFLFAYFTTDFANFNNMPPFDSICCAVKQQKTDNYLILKGTIWNWKKTQNLATVRCCLLV